MNYKDYKKIGLHIDLSRCKPSAEQLDISMDMIKIDLREILSG